MFQTMLIFAWYGLNAASGESIYIPPEQSVQQGDAVEVFHWTRGQYIYEEVLDADEQHLETYYPESGSYRIYYMEKKPPIRDYRTLDPYDNRH